MSTKILKNKTWKYLFPCFKEYGAEFITQYNKIKKVKLGILDFNIDLRLNSATKEEILAEKLVFIQVDYSETYGTFHTKFLPYIKTKSFYFTDYLTTNVETGKDNHIVVLRVPHVHHRTFNLFLEGKYSQMYTAEQLSKYFGAPILAPSLEVLNKEVVHEAKYINKLNEEFGTTAKFHYGELEEYDTPLVWEEETLNNQIKSQIYIDKTWKEKLKKHRGLMKVN